MNTARQLAIRAIVGWRQSGLRSGSTASATEDSCLAV